MANLQNKFQNDTNESKGKSRFPIYDILNRFEAESFKNPMIKTHHRSLYYFLVSVCMQRYGMNPLQIAYDYGMAGSKIGNHATYTKVLRELEDAGFLKYTPGKNRWSFPIIELHFCKPTADLLHAYRQSICQSNGLSTAHNKDYNNKQEDKETAEYVSLFNKKFGKSFKCTEQVAEGWAARRKDGYILNHIEVAINNASKDNYHIENSFKFLTPEFFTRPDQIEKWKNATPKEEKKILIGKLGN